MRAFVRSLFIIGTPKYFVGEKSRWLYIGECWVPVRVYPMPLVHEVSMRAHVCTFVRIDVLDVSRLWRWWKVVPSWGNFPILDWFEVITDFDRHVPLQARHAHDVIYFG